MEIKVDLKNKQMRSTSEERLKNKRLVETSHLGANEQNNKMSEGHRNAADNVNEEVHNTLHSNYEMCKMRGGCVQMKMAVVQKIKSRGK